MFECPLCNKAPFKREKSMIDHARDKHGVSLYYQTKCIIPFGAPFPEIENNK